jgi:uncharacterized surface protein with fasciclin (FAS1) repeats
MRANRILSTAGVMAVTCMLAAPQVSAQQQTPATPPSIWTEAERHGFHEWHRAAQTAGLQDRLGTRAHTVFIADDAAWQQVPATQRQAWQSDPAAHRAVLGHTVIEGRLTYDQLRQRDHVMTIDGTRVPVRVDGDNVFVGDARVSRWDLEAGNGLIHQVDRVSWPQQQAQQLQPAQQQMQPAQQQAQPAMTPAVREPVRKNW